MQSMQSQGHCEHFQLSAAFLIWITWRKPCGRRVRDSMLHCYRCLPQPGVCCQGIVPVCRAAMQACQTDSDYDLCCAWSAQGQVSCDSIHVHMHGKSRRMFCDVFCRFACQDLVGEKLLAVAKRKPKTSAMAGSPDNVETQPLDPGIPAIAAPEFLPQVLLSLESVRPFPHELQYKKPFRSLCRASDSGDPVPLSTYATYACAL